jgi:tetratricopeptide (TPR) repeat protein
MIKRIILTLMVICFVSPAGSWSQASQAAVKPRQQAVSETAVAGGRMADNAQVTQNDGKATAGEGEAVSESPVIEPSGSPQYDQAVRHIQNGRYEDAVVIMKEMLRQKIDNPRLQEALWRRLADCQYFMGEKGDQKDLLAAVDHYKNVLRNYPDVRPGNDLVYYRLSVIYEKVKFFYEGQAAAEHLLTKYPDSPYGQEVLFMAARMFQQTDKQDQAIQKYQAYLQKYPQGKYAKISAFKIGEGYFAAKRMDLAARWYGEALGRWPDIEDLPQDTLLNLGHHSYRAGRYGEAVHQFSLYLSLYGPEGSGKSAMYAMACSFLAMDQAPRAMKLFSQVIERYPESSEAWESIITLANIGVARPNIKPLLPLAAMDYYKDPLGAYDELLKRNPPDDLAERLLYRKGDALLSYGRHEEALDINLYLLSRFSKGASSQDAKRNLKSASTVLINRYYEMGDHAAVADIYFKAYGKMLIVMDDAPLMLKIGDSLNRIGLFEDALNLSARLGSQKADKQGIPGLASAPAKVGSLVNIKEVREDKIIRLLREGPPADERKMQKVKKMLGDLYYGKGLYEQAVRSYEEALACRCEMDDPAKTYLRYGDALKELNRCPQAELQYHKAIALSGQQSPARSYLMADAYMGLGDCQYRQGRFGDGLASYEKAAKYVPDRQRQAWSIYGMGQSLRMLAEGPEMEKTFARLRASGDEGFWSKVVDYRMADQKWLETYGEYLRK